MHLIDYPLYDSFDDDSMSMTDNLLYDLDNEFFTSTSHDDQDLHIDATQFRYF